MRINLYAVFAALMFPVALAAQTVPSLATDGNLETVFEGTPGVNAIALAPTTTDKVLSYNVYSGTDVSCDPVHWTLKGSNNGKKWKVIDERSGQKFCSRYQPILCSVDKPVEYKFYRLDVEAAQGKAVQVAEVMLFHHDMWAGWKNFHYPEIDFRSSNPETEGAKIYMNLVQNPTEYISYHCRKVCEILFWSDADPIPGVKKITYDLRDQEGISAKSGNVPNIHIFYSTRWVEGSAKTSLYKLDNETRGVLYHELTHGYQYWPKGIGSYGNNKTHWACIEGIADAVRAEAGLFDWATRRPGGNWMDGYRTTGFFIQWLTTKDPDAIRKFHRTVRDMEVWSFDGAIKLVFGEQASIEQMWDEYQTYLKSNPPAPGPGRSE